jgi:hypothetical protein
VRHPSVFEQKQPRVWRPANHTPHAANPLWAPLSAPPDCVEWTERSAAALRGMWGRLTPGRLADRCLVHGWPSRGG